MHYGYYMLIISDACVVRLDCSRIFDHVTGSECVIHGRYYEFIYGGKV